MPLALPRRLLRYKTTLNATKTPVLLSFPAAGLTSEGLDVAVAQGDQFLQARVEILH